MPPGQIFGELSVLSGTGSFFEAKVDCNTAVVLRVPRGKCIKCGPWCAGA